MSVFISLTTDAFQENFAKQKKDKERARRAGTSNARRPLRGLEIKDDTYAIIKVINAAGSEIPLIDSGSPSGFNTQYTNFILQSVNEARMEKHQIVETFGESYIFFFGESPRFLDVQAVLVDSQDFNWYAEFWENYNQYLRGTKSVEMGARTYLFYDDNIVEGYMLQAQAQKVSDAPLMARLSFRLYLTSYQNISFVGDPNFPVRGSIILPGGVSDINLLTQDPAAYAATLGANLQQLGFGGGRTLSQALRNGADASSLPIALQPILQNAEEAFGISNGTFRQKPLRQLIAENVDEFTGLPPSELSINEELYSDQLQEAQDLAQQALASLKQIANIRVTPTLTNRLGLAPNFIQNGIGIGFGSSSGVGFGAQANVRASFGVSAGVSFRGQVTTGAGLGGGLGFSGRASAGIGFGASAGASFSASAGIGFGASAGVFAGAGAGFSSQTGGGLNNQLNAASFRDVLDSNFSSSFSAGSGSYQGGVLTAGISAGVGIGGGVSGGVSAASGFSSGPSALPPSSGGGSGVNRSVGGASTAFAMVAVEGKLTPDGFSSSSSSFSGSTF